MSQESVEYVSPPARGPWALAWRRLKRDRVALGCGIFLVLLVLAVGPGAALYERLVGHGPNDLFPYAVSVQLRRAGPFTLVVMALDPTLARSSRRGLLRLAGRTA